ncbi:MAG TPA: hypothetical protein VD866_04920 [Urbifossiella sp.]|nr:hypothetical protein [Urbifossiella sp.]
MSLTVAVGLAVLLAPPEHAAPLLGIRVGSVQILGNTDAPDELVLSLAEVYPAKLIAFGDFHAARQRLRAHPAFRSNPWRGPGPTVTLIPSVAGDVFWDVEIRVTDRPGTWPAHVLLDLMATALRVRSGDAEPWYFLWRLEHAGYRLAEACGAKP